MFHHKYEHDLQSFGFHFLVVPVSARVYSKQRPQGCLKYRTVFRKSLREFFFCVCVSI